MKNKIKITGLTIFLILGLVTLGTTNAKPNEDIRIETYIEQEMDRNIIPGLSVGIIENGEIIYLRGFGQADLSNRQVKPKLLLL